MMRLLSAKVGHERKKPAHNRFTYNVFYIDIPVTDLQIPRPKLLSFDRFNVFSLYARDHGARDDSSWRVWFEGECEARGITLEDSDTVRLISHPRLFGYAFNPISFWLLEDVDHNLRAVLCEVNNTFGDNHNYLLAHDNGSFIHASDSFNAQKKLYVSPFNKVQGHYIFSFDVRPDSFKVSINYFVGEERVLSTFMGGTFTPLDSWSILRATLLYPLMTVLIVGRIHWQALRLRLKGVQPTISSMPPPLKGGTTQGSSTSE